MIKEAEMEEHKARCNEIQVLKFGQLIDLEMVDKVCLVLFLYFPVVSTTFSIIHGCTLFSCTPPQPSNLPISHQHSVHESSTLSRHCTSN